MEKLSLSSTSSPTLPRPFLSPSLPLPRTWRKVSFACPANPRKFSVCASTNDDSSKKFDQFDLMELKFGQMIGEDPKLTMAKIMGRKINPDACYLEIEKNFYKNKGKMVEVKEVPFDVPEKLGSKKAKNGLNLEKPVPKKGIKVGGGEKGEMVEVNEVPFDVPEKLGSIKAKNGLNLVRPVPKKGIKVGGGEGSSKLAEIKKPDYSSRKKAVSATATKSNVPNVILRKPTVYNEKDDEMESSSRLRMKPNLSPSMRTEPVKEKFCGMTLLKRPESIQMAEDHDNENENNLMNGSTYGGLTSGAAKDFEGNSTNGQQDAMTSYDGMMLRKPKGIMNQNVDETGCAAMSGGMTGIVGDFTCPKSKRDLIPNQSEQGEGSQTEMQRLEQTKGFSTSESSVESVLMGRPKRLNQLLKEVAYPIGEAADSVYSESFDDQSAEDKLLLSRPLKEIEEMDWKWVERRFNAGDRVEVVLICCSPRGFVVSCRSLIGFLPYRNVAAKWRFLDFESWVRRNGLNPSKYRQDLGTDPSTSLESSYSAGVNQKAELKLTADLELEDLLNIYDHEKMKYLSSYVGQHIKLNILVADKESRKLIFSMWAKEKEEAIEKKRSLMAKLSVGDVVKCCIKKINYFGIFAEVEGVSAMIHPSEVSWDATLDLASYPKTGQIVKAKVHRLDFALERIFLSLKEITPDPLNEALECIVGNCSFNGGLEANQADYEWPEVDSLVKALLEVDGVQAVNKVRFFLSPGLAPTFQVYMASMFENQYKLLARSGNKVQEVMVKASLGKDDMKAVILKCTNRVGL